MGHQQRSWHPRVCRVEPLEPRQLLSASGVVTPNIVVSPSNSARPFVAGSASPIGLTPAQVRAAYGFDSIINNTARSITFGGVKADGAGQTIAIVDAFDNPNIKASLAAFDKQFGIADPGNNAFKIVDQTGSTTLPPPDAGWATEIALDVEWVHAMAPAANILLVEAISDSMTDLMSAVDYARGQNGVVAVCCSWGGPEDPTEATFDTIFTSPAGRGVTFVVAAGDDGAPATYPSASPNVLSVGGTNLTVSNNRYGSETVWNDGIVIGGVGGLIGGISGGGASLYERAPTFQKSIGQKMRGTPDVSASAGGSGFAVYDSFNNTRTGGWYTTGVLGTSGAAPLWAALVAVADQGRARLGKGSLANAQAALYSLPRTDFHDITSGSNGVDLAKVGYDLASGLGSPRANLLIPALVAWNGSTTLPTPTAPASSTTTPGSWWWTKYFGHPGSASASLAGTSSETLVSAAVPLAVGPSSTDPVGSVPAAAAEQQLTSSVASDNLPQVVLDSQDREASLPQRIGSAKHASQSSINALDSVFSHYDPAAFLQVA
jgi:subtilase family serine protease